MTDSPLDPIKLKRARELLAEPRRKERVAPVAAAAVCFALSAMALAATVMAIPPQWSG